MNNINPLTFNPRINKVENEQRKQRNYQNLKPAYQAMNWKNYALNRPRNISLQEADRMSAKNSVRQQYSPSYFDQEAYQSSKASHVSAKKMREQNLRLSNVSYNSRREDHAQRVKQDAIRRVKMLQQKVLPLITTDKHLEDQNQEYGLAWQLKMQQKLARIETSIENVRNEMEIKYEKRLIEMERQWESRINQLMGIVVEGEYGYGKVEMGVVDDGRECDQERNQFMTTATTTTKPVSNTNSGKYNYYRSGFTSRTTINKDQNTQQINK